MSVLPDVDSVNGKTFSGICFYRATLCVSAILTVSRCPSVCPSVTQSVVPTN